MSETLPDLRRSGNGRHRKLPLGLRVLVVEDDEQVASVLAALLETEGYDVTTANTAEGGLARLREKPWHLLITDYWLPDKTGAWMLAEASRNGWMTSCQVLVVTAEHHPQGVENLTVLRKPLDLDDFLRVVHDTLAPVREVELARVRSDVARKTADGDPKLELTLYISASSPTSLRAMRNLVNLLAEYDASQVRLAITDLSREISPSAEEDRIAFTPTLVKRAPGPRVWVLGDLNDPQVVLDLLAHAGVERAR